MASDYYPNERLGNVAGIIMGQSPPGSTYNENGNGLPFFQGIRDFNYRHPSLRVFCSAPSRVAQPGDILLSVRAPIGRVNIADRVCCIGRGLSIVRAKSDLDQRFIEFVLRFLEPSWQSVEGGGSVFGNATKNDLESLPIPWPKPVERQAIAHILGSLDDKIELNRRMNKALEATARAIFKSWFVDFDPVRAKAEGRPTGLPDDIAALFPDSFEDSELGEIPKGWEVVTFEELTEAKQGKYIPKNDMSDIPTNEHIYPVWGGNGIRGYSSTYMYEEPVVVLTCRGSNCGRIDLTESPAWISNIAFACSPKYGSINFINVYFHFSSFSETITGSAQPQITYTSLKNKRMQFPVHKEICDAYSKKIDSLYMMIRENNRQSTTLATLRDTLLPKLISGELRVPDAEKFVEEAGL